MVSFLDIKPNHLLGIVCFYYYHYIWLLSSLYVAHLHWSLVTYTEAAWT